MSFLNEVFHYVHTHTFILHTHSLCTHYSHYTHTHILTLYTLSHHLHTLTCAQVYLRARFIMNGVCVLWVGWIDLETLNGKARLVFDEEQAKVSSDTFTLVPKHTL